MEKEQAKEILEMISGAYTQFELDPARVKVWTKQLLEMDYGHVVYNFEKYIKSEKWPPTIADIAAFPRRKDPTLEKIERFHEEALSKTDPEEFKRVTQKNLRKVKEMVNAKKHRS